MLGGKGRKEYFPARDILQMFALNRALECFGEMD